MLNAAQANTRQAWVQQRQARAKTAEQAVAMIATWYAGQDKDDSWLLHLDSACSNMKNPTKLALEEKCAGKQISWCKKCVRNRKTK